MAGSAAPHPWGVCEQEGCGVVGLRCVKYQCPRHCEENHTEGVDVHAPRNEWDTKRLEPIYTLNPPQLVAEELREEAKAA